LTLQVSKTPQNEYSSNQNNEKKKVKSHVEKGNKHKCFDWSVQISDILNSKSTILAMTVIIICDMQI